MSGNNDGSGVILLCMAGVGLAGLFISNTFGVPFLEGIKILPKLLVWLVVFGLITYSGFLRSVIPIALATLWACFTPILDYKAGWRPEDSFQPEVAWYGTSSGQTIVFFAILIIGYGILYWINSRNRYY
ncbi:hypothetical protein NLH84_004305 [Escherichia coli]|nr:hypothetical protein [Escherichia coli]